MIHYKLVHYTRISVKHCRVIRNVFSQNCLNIFPLSPFTIQRMAFISLHVITHTKKNCSDFVKKKKKSELADSIILVRLKSTQIKGQTNQSHLHRTSLCVLHPGFQYCCKSSNTHTVTYGAFALKTPGPFLACKRRWDSRQVSRHPPSLWSPGLQAAVGQQTSE